MSFQMKICNSMFGKQYNLLRNHYVNYLNTRFGSNPLSKAYNRHISTGKITATRYRSYANLLKDKRDKKR